MQSAPCTNDSSASPGTAERMARMSLERVLAREHDALHAELLEHRRAGAVVHRHLRRAVDLEPGIHAPDQAHEADILHDHRVYSAVDALAQQRERVVELRGLDERVERQVHARAARVREAARLVELLEGELRAIVARIESLGAEVDGVGAVGDCCPCGIERAGGREELGDGARRHLNAKASALLPRIPRRARRPRDPSRRLRPRRGASRLSARSRNCRTRSRVTPSIFPISSSVCSRSSSSPK